MINHVFLYQITPSARGQLGAGTKIHNFISMSDMKSRPASLIHAGAGEGAEVGRAPSLRYRRFAAIVASMAWG